MGEFSALWGYKYRKYLKNSCAARYMIQIIHSVAIKPAVLRLINANQIVKVDFEVDL
jgi:hypothetical protein